MIFISKEQKGSISGAAILAMVMSLLFVIALGFGAWAFIGMQENQTNLDAKIEVASDVAVKEAESAKEVEFAERSKNPYRPYKGLDTYGALTFSFPKTWSAYAKEANSGTLLDFYAHPDVVPEAKKGTLFALRVQTLDTTYDREVEKFNSKAEKGQVTISPYRLEKVPGELGTIIRGEITADVQGIVVLLPQRDKTFKIWTESDSFVNDFEKILKSTSFVP